MLAHEGEIVEVFARHQPQQGLDMGLPVLAQFRQHAGIGGFGEAAHVLQHFRPQRLAGLARGRAQVRRRSGNDAEFGEARLRLPQRPEIEGGDGHAVNS